MSLTDTVLRPIAAFVLAAVVANCNQGCLPGWTQLSPAEAYGMEVSGCLAAYDRDVKACANQAETVPQFQECKDEAEEKHRICRGNVDRKYLKYNSEGGYPSEQPAPSR